MPLFVRSKRVSLLIPKGPNKGVNINLARIKILINCEPLRCHSVRDILGAKCANVNEGTPRAAAL